MDTTTHKRHIGQLCQRIRLEVHEWTLYRAEQESGLQGVQIKAIEAGTSDYTIDTLVRYCSALGIAIDLSYRNPDK